MCSYKETGKVRECLIYLTVNICLRKNHLMKKKILSYHIYNQPTITIPHRYRSVARTFFVYY